MRLGTWEMNRMIERVKPQLTRATFMKVFGYIAKVISYQETFGDKDCLACNLREELIELFGGLAFDPDFNDVEREEFVAMDLFQVQERKRKGPNLSAAQNNRATIGQPLKKCVPHQRSSRWGKVPGARGDDDVEEERRATSQPADTPTATRQRSVDPFLSPTINTQLRRQPSGLSRQLHESQMQRAEGGSHQTPQRSPGSAPGSGSSAGPGVMTLWDPSQSSAQHGQHPRYPHGTQPVDPRMLPYQHTGWAQTPYGQTSYALTCHTHLPMAMLTTNLVASMAFNHPDLTRQAKVSTILPLGLAPKDNPAKVEDLGGMTRVTAMESTTPSEFMVGAVSYSRKLCLVLQQ
ncbi:hypothetical protein FALCPG4_001868 [Fusarium falciforme]